ncbi:MAG: protein kinase domain-containing protein [Deltaproteobacteria bacterium]
MPIFSVEERVGRTLDGKYKVGRPIATGGMGVVYRGEHTWTGRQVAVKVLRAGVSADEDVQRRFLTEARASAVIRHPNVVDVLDMGRDEDGALYMVLELLDGRGLDDVLDERRVLSADEAIAVLAPVLEGLAHAHAKGFVHRDIKPSNIFLGVDERGVVTPKILDFGIAKALDGGANKTTQTGVIIGTPFYMSPEQASGSAALGPASDTWSVGVLLFEALSGQLPITGVSPANILANLLTQVPPSLATVAPALPPDLLALVDAMLDRDPDARPTDLRECAARLRRLQPSAPENLLRNLLASSDAPKPRDPEVATARTVLATPAATSAGGGTTPFLLRSPPTRQQTAPGSRPRNVPRWLAPAAVSAAVGLAGGVVWWLARPAGAPGAASSAPPMSAAPEVPETEVPETEVTEVMETEVMETVVMETGPAAPAEAEPGPTTNAMTPAPDPARPERASEEPRRRPPTAERTAAPPAAEPRVEPERPPEPEVRPAARPGVPAMDPTPAPITTVEETW